MFRMRKLDLNKRQSAVRPECFRRNTTMFPESTCSAKEVQDTLAVRFHHLLVSLEGSERSGCLKIESARTRSRSAILLYRGRVVGCIYGRKSMVCQHLAQDAHKYALSDLASPGNVVEAYELSEELVLCAAALFNGHSVQLNPDPVPATVFEQAMAGAVRSGLPASVVLTSYDNEAVCIVYVFQGQVIGVHSASQGWLKNLKPDVLRQFVRDLGPVRVMAAVLPPPADQRAIGFSLTGLGDRPSVTALMQSIDAISQTGTAIQDPSAQLSSSGQVQVTTSVSMGAIKGHHTHRQRTHERSTFNITPV